MLYQIHIPVFALNLKNRKDRKQHIQKQFYQKEEFDLDIVEACEHPNGAIGLWKSITRILEKLEDAKSDFVIICEDDHEFTKHYSRDILYRCIQEAQERESDILSGGVSWFKDAIQISKDLF